jgi:hypothetical protein
MAEVMGVGGVQKEVVFAVGRPPSRLSADPFEAVMVERGQQLQEVVSLRRREALALPTPVQNRLDQMCAQSTAHSQQEQLRPRLLYLLRDVDSDPESSWTLVCARSRSERFDGLQLRVDQIVDLRSAGSAPLAVLGGSPSPGRFHRAQKEARRFAIVYTLHAGDGLKALELECADEKQRDQLVRNLKRIVGARKSRERRLAKHLWVGAGVSTRWSAGQASANEHWC